VSAAPSPRPSYRWSDWTVEDLLEAKNLSATSVSLVLPARDEAATVGGIVTRVREELVDRAPLVDEIVVIDSDSSDATAEVARDAGATVHAASGIRPDLGARSGKGEAMWKSLFVARGDVLVFMDADLTAWDTHFVTGLLGPLLADDAALVKGFYDRPMGEAARPRDEVPSEGGRVTEVVARPLLALHWPDLAGVVQPLAGEWAVRRGLLEQLRVPSGYAVELAVLVDAYERLGLDAVAQVDLGLRRHGHQGLRDLGVMALQIQALVQARTSARPAAEELTLRQYDWATGAAVPLDRTVDLRERPPAVTVPGYAERRQAVGPC
jgi:glucosyl-3-phosphoglycerate synthase